MQDSEKQYPDRRSDFIDDDDLYVDDFDTEIPSLPRNGLSIALVIGALGGLLNIAISVATTLGNLSAYHDAVRLGNNMSMATAQLLVGLSCFNYTIELIVSFLVGFIVGKTAVSRRFGFYAGALMGAFTYIGGALLQYIPGYPGHINDASAAQFSSIQGALFALLLVIIWALVGALISLWGTYVASKKHPYYQARLQAKYQEELALEEE
jgi:hypothetical protein